MSSSALSPGSTPKRKMERQISDILDIHPRKKSWTALIQVVERNSPRESQPKDNQPRRVYRNYVLTDMKGVMVGIVVYDHHIASFEKTLLPYKRYYVSNAKVRPAIPIYRIGNYEYSWVISKGTLVEPFPEDTPTLLPCAFEFVKFSELQYHADKGSFLTIKALIVAEFPTIQVNDIKTTKDYVIINEENIPAILRVWNDLTDSVELKLTFTGEPIVIIATKLRVTTFDGLTLCTRSSTYFMENPPIHEDVPLLGWYRNNVSTVKEILSNKAYRATSKLMPAPDESTVVSIAEAILNIDTTKTAWVSGKVHMVPAQENIWYAACANCNAYVNVDIAGEIVCPSCEILTDLVLRCRLDLFLSDGGKTIQVVVSTPKAEQLIPFSSLELRTAYIQGTMPKAEIEKAIEKKNVTCLIRYYDKTFKGVDIRTYPVVKLYVVEQEAIAQTQRKEHVVGFIRGQSDVSTITTHDFMPPDKHAKAVAVTQTLEKQLFSPTTKAIIEEISSENAEVAIVPAQTGRVKRSLKIDPSGPIAHSTPNITSLEMIRSIKMEGQTVTGASGDGIGKRTKNKMDEV